MRTLIVLLITFALVHVQCADVTYRVVGSNGNADYLLNINNANASDPALSVTEGDRLIFRIEFSASFHPLGIFNGSSPATSAADPLDITQSFFNFTQSGCTKSNVFSWYTTDTAAPATNPCILSLTVPTIDPFTPVQYGCSVHSGMRGTINIAAAATTAPTTTDAPTTTAPTSAPTNATGTTTLPPTNPAPTNATGTTTLPPTNPATATPTSTPGPSSSSVSSSSIASSVSVSSTGGATSSRVAASTSSGASSSASPSSSSVGSTGSTTSPPTRPANDASRTITAPFMLMAVISAFTALAAF